MDTRYGQTIFSLTTFLFFFCTYKIRVFIIVYKYGPLYYVCFSPPLYWNRMDNFKYFWFLFVWFSLNSQKTVPLVDGCKQRLSVLFLFYFCTMDVRSVWCSFYVNVQDFLLLSWPLRQRLLSWTFFLQKLFHPIAGAFNDVYSQGACAEKLCHIITHYRWEVLRKITYAISNDFPIPDGWSYCAFT